MSSVAAEPPVDLAALWRAARYPVVLIVIALALATVLAAIGRSPNTTALDPRNSDPGGAHALAALLQDRGVAVTVAGSLAQVPSTAGTTILVSNPAALSDRALATIAATTANVVAIEPQQRELSLLGLNDVTVDARIPAGTIDPACALSPAVVAGSARISGDLYAVKGVATTCYHEGADAALVEAARANGGSTVVFGSGSTLTNAELGQQGDAALALGLLDATRLIWVPAGLHAGVVPKSRQGLFNLLPSRLLWATLQVFIALVVLALWRARRLGRPVVEPLPVVVRAAETTEGRGRLLQAAHARALAARSLREATTTRVSQALGGPDEDPEAVTALVAERTHRPATEINGLLYGGEPSDDSALVGLAQELQRLERDIDSSEPASPGGNP